MWPMADKTASNEAGVDARDTNETWSPLPTIPGGPGSHFDVTF